MCLKISPLNVSSNCIEEKLTCIGVKLRFVPDAAFMSILQAQTQYRYSAAFHYRFLQPIADLGVL